MPLTKHWGASPSFNSVVRCYVCPVKGPWNYVWKWQLVLSPETLSLDMVGNMSFTTYLCPCIIYRLRCSVSKHCCLLTFVTLIFTFVLGYKGIWSVHLNGVEAWKKEKKEWKGRKVFFSLPINLLILPLPQSLCPFHSLSESVHLPIIQLCLCVFVCLYVSVFLSLCLAICINGQLWLFCLCICDFACQLFCVWLSVSNVFSFKLYIYDWDSGALEKERRQKREKFV